MTPVEGNDYPVQQPGVVDTLKEIAQDAAPVIQVAEQVADAVGIDYKGSYESLLTAYNDMMTAHDKLKEDYEKLTAALSKHSNIITHLGNLFKEMF